MLIIEDVTTAGTSIRETVPILRTAADVSLAGLIVSVDRMERGTSDVSALDQIAAEFSMPTHAIVTVRDIIEHANLDKETIDKMEAYLTKYGPIT